MKAKAPFKNKYKKVIHQTAEQLRAEVYPEINSRRVEPAVIERSSRDEIKQAKKAWKKNPVRDNEVVNAFSKGIDRLRVFNVRFNAL